MKSAAEIEVERQVRIELLRMRAAVQREELCHLGCELLQQAQPQQLLGRFLGFGGRSLQTFKWGRTLWGLHRRYELLLSSAWLLFTGIRGRNLRWPTVSLLALRLLRFGLERRADQSATRQSALAGPTATTKAGAIGPAQGGRGRRSRRARADTAIGSSAPMRPAALGATSDAAYQGQKQSSIGSTAPVAPPRRGRRS